MSHLTTVKGWMREKKHIMWIVKQPFWLFTCWFIHSLLMLSDTNCCQTTVSAQECKAANVSIFTCSWCSLLHLITCARCHCFQCTLYKGPDNHTAWSCNTSNKPPHVISHVCTATFQVELWCFVTDLLKEPIWRSLFITAPSTSPKKSPVWERSNIKAHSHTYAVWTN